MITVNQEHDQQLCTRLESLSRNNSDYWSFKGNSCREHGHGLFQYPAMMVPQLARAILQEACAVHPDIEWIADPYSGSGTILTESMLGGLNFIGIDINPLAILLCRTKAGPFFIDSLQKKISKIKQKIQKDRRRRIEIDFPNREKWFRKDIQIQLSKIRRAITAESSIWARRFFWIAMAETIRLTSNSRTSTYKLHIRPKVDIENRNGSAIDIFNKLIDRNLKHLQDQATFLNDAGLLLKGRYTGDVQITLKDIREINNTRSCDIILTSPPYGDNETTVTYGQHSYLPLQWIDVSDIDSYADETFLCSTHEIDTRSLGGSKRIDKETRESLCKTSPTLDAFLKLIENQPSDRANRVIAYFRDLNDSIVPIMNMLNPGGLMFWILGNRNVGGYSVPLDKVLTEFLLERDAYLLITINRDISNKRMAPKNNVTDTISTEKILVLRRSI